MAHGHDDAHGHDEYDVPLHISPVTLYVTVLMILFGLTLLTLGAYQIHLGTWNLVVAVVIATIKATLVCLYFMHMKYEQKFNVLVFLGALVFAGVFLVYTINDTNHRAEVDEYNGAKIDPATGMLPPGSAPGLVAMHQEIRTPAPATGGDVAPASPEGAGGTEAAPPPTPPAQQGQPGAEGEGASGPTPAQGAEAAGSEGAQPPAQPAQPAQPVQ